MQPEKQESKSALPKEQIQQLVDFLNAIHDPQGIKAWRAEDKNIVHVSPSIINLPRQEKKSESTLGEDVSKLFLKDFKQASEAGFTDLTIQQFNKNIISKDKHYAHYYIFEIEKSLPFLKDLLELAVEYLKWHPIDDSRITKINEINLKYQELKISLEQIVLKISLDTSASSKELTDLINSFTKKKPTLKADDDYYSELKHIQQKLSNYKPPQAKTTKYIHRGPNLQLPDEIKKSCTLIDDISKLSEQAKINIQSAQQKVEEADKAISSIFDGAYSPLAGIIKDSAGIPKKSGEEKTTRLADATSNKDKITREEGGPPSFRKKS